MHAGHAHHGGLIVLSTLACLLALEEEGTSMSIMEVRKGEKGSLSKQVTGNLLK
jgi:hypothetical protein